MPEHYGFCASCRRELFSGRNEFYVVEIRAYADPTPPEIDGNMTAEQAEQEYKELIQLLSNVSAQEAMDEVYRQQTIALCNECFPNWYDNPAGD